MYYPMMIYCVRQACGERLRPRVRAGADGSEVHEGHPLLLHEAIQEGGPGGGRKEGEKEGSKGWSDGECLHFGVWARSVSLVSVSVCLSVHLCPRTKLEQFKQRQLWQDALHARFDCTTGESVTQDAEWGHLQVLVGAPAGTGGGTGRYWWGHLQVLVGAPAGTMTHTRTCTCNMQHTHTW